MISVKAQNRRAFANGFTDGFGNVGQVFEPILDGCSILKDVKEPVRIRLYRNKRNVGFYTQKQKDGTVLTGVRRER